MQHTKWRAKYANYGNRDLRMLFSASLSHALDPFGARWILVCEASDAFSAPRIPRPTAHDPLGVPWILVCETSDAFSASCIPRPNAHDPLGVQWILMYETSDPFSARRILRPNARDSPLAIFAKNVFLGFSMVWRQKC